MALTTAQQAQQLFKASQGKSSTNVVRDFFEEPRDGRPIVYPANIWAESVKIPATAPGGVDAAITGVVQRFIGKTLTAVPGTTNSFFHADLVDCIPFNTGDGSYNYALTDSTGASIPFGLGDWIVDPNTGTLTFYSTVPANMPPKLSFYKYVGVKGTAPPRYTTAEINAIVAPVAGQQVYDTTVNQYKFWNGTAWTAIGAGGGSGDGAVNYITNGKAENDTAGWTVFDGAVSQPQANLGNGTVDELGDIININTSPRVFRDNQPIVYTTTGTAIGGLVNGQQYWMYAPLPGAGSSFAFGLRASLNGPQIDLTGEGTGTHTFTPLQPFFGTEVGTPAITLTRTTTSPIRGAASFLLSKPAQNCRGQGISTGFTIDAADKGKLCVFTTELDVPTGLALGDLVWYMVDTTANLLNDANIVTPVSTGIQQIGFTFTPPTTGGVAYRLIGFVATTSATAWTQKFDSVAVGPVNLPATVFAMNPDSTFQLNGFSTAAGSSQTNMIRMIGGTQYSTGDAFQFIQDAANGDRLVALKDGYGTVNFSADPASANSAYILTRNQVTNAFPPPIDTRLAAGYGDVVSISWTGFIKKDDYFKLSISNANVADLTYSIFSAAMVGNVKSVQAVPGQKIRIPSSEVKFTSSTTRGSTDTWVVKYDTMNFLRGDAFEIVNNSVNGTYLRMKKTGVLSTSASIGGSTAQNVYISRNQANLGGVPTYDEQLAAGVAASNNYGDNLAWTGRVNIGDIIRVITAAGTTQTAQNYNNWSSFFWEDDISIAINTVLPIYSQSDSISRVTGFAGAGSTNTQVARFSNVVQNVGSDITYVPNAALGDYWIINTDGLFNFKHVGANSSTPIHIGVGRGPVVDLASAQANPNDMLAGDTTGSQNYFACASGTEFLTAGTIVRAWFNGGGPNALHSSFAISKVGKPNLTSVDVTPFATNYKTQDYQEVRAQGYNGFGSTYTQANRFSNILKNSNNGIVQFIQDAALGDYIVALKPCNVVVCFVSVASSGSPGTIGIGYNTNSATLSALTPAQRISGQAAPAGYSLECSATLKMNPGENLRFYSDSANNGLPTATLFSLMAIADTDSVIATSKQVSSDSMAFAFKSTAINPDTDPVGTFNTYTYAANSNTATLATVAPTQTPADMNANGFLIYGRGFNAAGTAAQPARFDVFVGKGLKGLTTFLYGAAAKTSALDPGYVFFGGGFEAGTQYVYTESTGVLTISVGTTNSGSTTTRWVGLNSTLGGQTTGYFVFNASANPALLSVPQLTKRIAVIRDEKPNGTAAQALSSGTYISRTLNTIQSDPSGLIKNPGSFPGVGGANTNFRLGTGTYQLRGSVTAFTSSNASVASGGRGRARIRNVTANTSAIVGQNTEITGALGSSTETMGSLSVIGIITVSGDTDFDLQHWTSNSGTTNGGIAISTGDNEVYSFLEIEKLN